MGINTLSFDKSNDGETPEGIGFAIPFQLATKIMDKLIRDGRVIRGYIGIGGREIAPMHTQGGGIDQIQGIVVNEVAPGVRRLTRGFRSMMSLCRSTARRRSLRWRRWIRWQKFARALSSLLKSCATIRN
jgi:S1-C subfamily serine protease